MLNVIKCLFCIGLAIGMVSCAHKNKKLVIQFSKDSTSIIVNNLDEASMLNLKKVYQANFDAINLISVSTITKDKEGLPFEEKISGNVKLIENGIVFTPINPFERGKTYRVESFIGTGFVSAEKIFKNEIQNNLVPQQQILTR